MKNRKIEVLIIESDCLNPTLIDTMIAVQPSEQNYKFLSSIAAVQAELANGNIFFDVIISGYQLKDGIISDLTQYLKNTNKLIPVILAYSYEDRKVVSALIDQKIDQEIESYCLIGQREAIKLLPSLINKIIHYKEIEVRAQLLEQELKCLKNISGALLNSVPDLILRISRQGVYLDCRGAEYFEPILPPEQIIGKTVVELLPPDLVTETLHYINQALQTNNIQVFNYQLPKGDEIGTYEARIAPCAENEVLVLVQDITQRIKNEALLLRQSRLVQGVAEATNCLLIQENYSVAIDHALQVLGNATEVSRIYIFENQFEQLDYESWSNQKFVWLSSTFLAKTASLASQAISCAETFSYKYSPRWFKLLSQGQVIKGLVKNFSESEQHFLAERGILSLMIIPIFVGDRFWGFIRLDDCVSLRHWSSEEESFLLILARGIGGLLERVQLLEQEVQQRKQLTQQNLELEKSRLHAERASQIKSAFLSTVSHEIRTPMNAVLGMAGLLLDSKLTSDQKDYVETIRTSGESLLKLINDILDCSKLEAQEIELEIFNFNLEVCIEEVVDLLATKAYGKGLEIAYLVPQDIPVYVRGDLSRFKQILTNLVDNAIKFTDEGEIFVRAELQSETSEDATFLFAISDTGIGIAPENLGQLFYPFYQIDSSNTRKHEGIGLGLSITKQLIEFLGGEINVESEIGKGSRFKFSITFEKQEAENQEKELASPLKCLESLEKFRELNLLLVSNVKSDCETLSYHISCWGIKIDIANSIEAALHHIQKNVDLNSSYDLAIFDQNLLDGSLIKLLKKLQAYPDLHLTKLILMTLPGQAKFVDKALKLGFSAHLTKPIHPSCVFKCFTEVIAPEISFLAEEVDQKKSNHLAFDSDRSIVKPKILLVEDNPINQKVVLKQLNNLGHQADVAANGREAIAAIAQIHYDLILMDCQMPVLDGYEATKTIRSIAEQNQNQRPHPIIIAMTANTLPEERDRAFTVGMNDYLQKPVSKEKLALTIARWSQVIAQAHNSQTALTFDRAPLTVQPVSTLPYATSPHTVESDSRLQLDLEVDWEQLHQISDGNPEFELELLHLFVKDSANHLGTLEQAIANKDFYQLERAAHHLKGASANVGIRTLQAIASQLEDQARQQQLDNPIHLLTGLKDALDKISRYIASRHFGF
jgi:signal transduction histidine kinase/CheY-like chemotaxis protein/PAS domain-containing protein